MRLLAILIVAALCSTGCIQITPGLDADLDYLMRNADEYMLYSLDPGPDDPNAPERFHKHVVLGKHSMPKGKDRDWLTANIDRALVTKPENLSNRLGTRHGMRVRRGEKVVEFLFDYATYTVTIFKDDQSTTRPTSHLSMSMIETTLARAGVPLHGVRQQVEK